MEGARVTWILCGCLSPGSAVGQGLRPFVVYPLEVSFDFLYNFCLKHFSFQAEPSLMLLQMHTGPRIENPLILADLNEISVSSEDFRKILKYKIPQNSVQCCMRTDGQTDMKLAAVLVILRTCLRRKIPNFKSTCCSCSQEIRRIIWKPNAPHNANRT